MLRTNSKKAVKNLKNFVIDSTNFDLMDEMIEGGDYSPLVTPPDFDECAYFIYYCFRKEMLQYNRLYAAGKITENELFITWCEGLAGALDTTYYLGGTSVDVLGDILEETEEERKRFSPFESEKALTKLIYREIIKSVDKRYKHRWRVFGN